MSKALLKRKAWLNGLKKSESLYFLDTYGWVIAKTDINKAIKVLEKVNVMDAHVPVFKYHLGVAYHKQGNNAGAAAQLQEALSLHKQGRQFAESQLAEQLLNKIKLTP